MGLSLRSLGKKIGDFGGRAVDQVNVFDNGRTYQHSTPTNNRSVVSQLTHNGATNFVGSGVVKPVAQVFPNVSNQLYNRVVAPIGNLPRQDLRVSALNPLVGSVAKFSGATGDIPQTLSSVANTALTIGSGGLAKGVEAGVVKVIPRTVPKLADQTLKNAATGAVLNTEFGESNYLGNTAKPTVGGALKVGGQSAALGAALGVGGTLAVPVVKTGSKAVVKAADNRVPLGQAGSVPLPRPKVSAKSPTTTVNAPVVSAGQGSVSPAKNGLLQEVKQGLSDKDQVILDELRNIEKQTGQKGLVDKFMYNSNMQRGSNAGANLDLQNSPNIQTAIGGLSKKDYQNFSDYANARTELASAGDKTPTSAPIADLQARVSAATPDHQARFEALNAHYKDLADKALESGLITPETHARYVADNNYIRIQRDMGDLLPPQASGRGNSYSLGKTVLSQKRKGSQRDILPAGETAADYTQRIYREAAKNKTGTFLVDTLSQHGLATKLKNAADATHKNAVTIIRNGKTEHYEVSPQIKEAVQNINPYHMNAVMQILAAPGRVLRAGVTGLNPVFIARNLVKDQAGTAINSEALRSTHSPASFFSGLFHASRDAIGSSHDPLYNDFLRHYGDQTSYDLTRNVKDTQQVINRIRGGKAVGIGQALKSPIRTAENFASITEKSTRFQNYRGAYKRAIKEGLPPEQASEKAAIAAWQNSVDFSRAGTWGRVINSVIPYWNPATQGVRQMARTFIKHPIKSPLVGTAIVGLPIATATAWNLSNPDTAAVYANIPEYEKDNNLILVPPGTKQNQDGSYDVVKIPLPPGFKDVFMPIRRSLEAYHNDKPVEGGKIAQDILQAVGGPVNTQSVGGFAGSFVPQGAKPFVQQYANRDLFTGKTIVPDFVNQAKDAQGNPVPENQKAYKYSSGTARNIGNALGVSPIRVEKFIKDTGGTVGLNALNAVDTTRAKVSNIPQEQVGGQSVQTGLKRSFGSAQGIKNSNATPGAKYFDNIKQVTSKLNGNELAGFNSLHPTKKNFLGDTVSEIDSTYNPAAKLDIYNRYPKVFEADKQLDKKSQQEGNPGNPLFKLQSWQVKKVLEKDNLPPGSKDPELSKLYTQPWYQDYQSQKSSYFSAVKTKAETSGKSFGSQTNPYPTTSAKLQKTMDYYSSLPKGNGARSTWIKSNPGQWQAMQDQFAKIDNWQNVQRGKRGLDTTEGAAGVAAGYGTSSGGSYGSGKKTDPSLNPRKYAVSLSAGGKVAQTKKAGKSVSFKSSARKIAISKPKISVKKSLV